MKNNSSPKWVKSENVCPKCNQATDELIEMHNRVEFVIAERCVKCKWETHFEED